MTVSYQCECHLHNVDILPYKIQLSNWKSYILQFISRNMPARRQIRYTGKTDIMNAVFKLALCWTKQINYNGMLTHLVSEWYVNRLNKSGGYNSPEEMRGPNIKFITDEGKRCSMK